MSNYVGNFGAKNYYNPTTIPQLIANNMSGCFFLKHGVVLYILCEVGWQADVFNWKEYLSHCGADAAPLDAFATVSSFIIGFACV